MNTGLVASRYSKALLEYAGQAGDVADVYRQASALLLAFASVPGFQKAVTDHTAVSVEKKMELLAAALGDDAMADSLQRFFALVARNDRMQDIRFMLKSFVDMYHESRNMRFAHLVTAVPVDDAFRARMRSQLSSAFGAEVVLEEEVDPSIIGGFILTVDDSRVDASVSGQLNALRAQYLDQNKRIV